MGSGGAAGGGEGGAGGADVAVLERIEVSPRNTLLDLDLEESATQSFTALARYSDGSSEDVTGRVAWSLDNAAVGELEGATLEVAGFDAVDAETTRVKALLDGLDGAAQLTVVAHRKTGADKDVLLILPLDEGGGTTVRPAALTPQQSALDLLMLMDVTNSMTGPLNQLKNGFTSPIASTAISLVPDSRFAIAGFADFPVDPYGSATCGTGRGDQPFILKQAITADVASASAAAGGLLVGGLPIGCGNDTPESMFEGLYQAATGQGLNGPGTTSVPAGVTGLGGVAFRASAVPAIVTVTDTMPHDPAGGISCNNVPLGYTGAVLQVAHDRAQAKAALGNLCARSLGVVIGTAVECSPAGDLIDLASSTGAFTVPAAWGEPGVNRPAGCAANQCCTWLNGAGTAPDAKGLCPLVYRVASNGVGFGSAVASGITALVKHAPFDVTLVASGSASSFVKAIAAKSHVLGNAAHPQPTAAASTFNDVFPGTSLTFDITGANDFTPQSESAKLFLGVLGASNGCFSVGSSALVVVVPPEPLPSSQ